ncbi:Uncharacterised protein [Salmonella enterica subsp. enterica serovar Bovismorbificans]|uniref:Uncharacterized protein n=1 Tax=Salmonella enterica subsp. enterica serovar Bovismorbificans TaxID=58097 RepID=A0A655DJH6_SALET|nr:Uncharacterised protein [Salmonella enterica subsp. enterica serovar Bovismorbificans]
MCPYSACIAQYAVQFIKHPLQTRRQLLPRLGQHHLTRSAIQQSNAGLPLQLFYAMTDRRLAQSNPVPCPTETFGLGDGNKNTQLTQ